MRITPFLIGFGTAALLAGGTSAAHADIEWNKSIDGVKLGWGRGKVLETKGEPRAKRKVHISQVGKGRAWAYGREGRRLTVLFYRGDVVRLTTRSKGQATPEGWGPGTLLSEVKAADPGYVENVCSKQGRGVWWCGNIPDPGERTTWFWARRGVITKFAVLEGLY